jgi:hypothetical protein
MSYRIQPDPTIVLLDACIAGDLTTIENVLATSPNLINAAKDKKVRPVPFSKFI